MRPPTEDRTHPVRSSATSDEPAEGRPGPGEAPLWGPSAAIPLEVLDRIVEDLFRVSLGLRAARRTPGRTGPAAEPAEEALDRVIGLIRGAVLDSLSPWPRAAVASGAGRSAR